MDSAVLSTSSLESDSASIAQLHIACNNIIQPIPSADTAVCDNDHDFPASHHNSLGVCAMSVM